MKISEAVRLRILELCEEKGITVNMLGTISGITQSTIYSITSGRNRSVAISTVKKLCDGLDISITEFLDSDLFRDLEQEIE